jgi:hypothetical protein
MKRCFLLFFLLILFTLPCLAQSGIDYFKGTWTVTMKDGPEGGFNWNVDSALDGSWLGGVVTREGKEISKDFWRQDGKTIERFAFSSDGFFLKISSSGWNGDKLVFTGSASNKSGEFNVRETITKVNAHRFLALWERQGQDGKWMIFSDETCTRHN